jgi:hypothetical protein
MSESEDESPVAAAGFMVLVCSTQSWSKCGTAFIFF